MSIASALRSVLCVLGIALISTIAPRASAQSTSTATDGFDPNVDGPVYAIQLQPDGKILFAGQFKSFTPNGGAQVGDGSTAMNIARVLPDGRNDPSFNARVDGQINAMVLQPDGKILIGGAFTSVNGDTSRLRIARLNADGSTDTSFTAVIQPGTPSLDTSLTPEVYAIALQADGRILVGGGFVQPNGSTPIKKLIRLSSTGQLDTSFAPNPDNTVLAIKVLDDGHIMVGGAFRSMTPAGGNVTIGTYSVARVNTDGTVDRKTNSDGTYPKNDADGTYVAAFDLRANYSVRVIETQPDGSMIFGGDFTSFRPTGASSDSTVGRLARVASDGTFGTGTAVFYASVDGPVHAIKVQPDGRILVGGAINTAGGTTRWFIARFLPNGLIDQSFVPLPNGEVDAIAIQPNGDIVFGGAFITLTGLNNQQVLRNHLARVTTNATTDRTFQPEATGRLRSIAVLNRTARKRILVGGTFGAIAGETHTGIALLNPDGTLDRSFTVSLDGAVAGAAEQDDGKIIIVGSFTRVNGVNRRYAARINPVDSSLDPDFNPAPNGQVNAVAIDGTSVYLGGSFTTLSPLGKPDPVTQSYLARVTMTGALDLTFNPQLNNSVNTIVVQSDHKVLVGGAFTAVVGVGSKLTNSRYGAVRFNSDGSVESTFHPNVNGVVYSMAQQSDGSVVVAGSFQEVIPDFTNLVTRWNIMRIKADGTLDDALDPRPNDGVNSVAILSDGSILMGGRFTTLAPKGGATLGRDYSYVARLQSNGDVDQNFAVQFDEMPGNTVIAVAASPTDGRALIAGAFASATAGGVTVHQSRLIQVTNAGAIDSSFAPDISRATGAPIGSITLLTDESLLVGGSFTGLNGTVTSGLARFNGDGMPLTTFVPSVNGTVRAIAQFPSKGAPIPTQRTGFAWLESNGLLRTSYVPAAEPTSFGTVTDMVVEASGNVLAAGTFTINSLPESLARLRPDGSVDTGFAPKTTGTISAVRVQTDGKILIGGTFTTVGGETRNNLARLNADGTLDTNFNPNVNSSVYEIELQSDGKILIGGSFSSVAPNGATTVTVRFGLARLNADGTVDTGFNPNPNGAVNSIVVRSGGTILVGGSFTNFTPNAGKTTTDRRYLALLNSDGSLDGTDFQVSGVVTKMKLQPADNKVILAGNFTSVRNEPRNYLARLNADLTLDSFNPNPNDVVYTVAVDAEGRILIGGSFTALQPNSASYDPALATPRYRAARLLPDGTIDALFNPKFNSQIGVMIAYPDGSIIAAGLFGTVQPYGSLLVGGAFSSVNEVPVANLALFGSDGSISSSFLPNPNGTVDAVLALPDGRAIVAGAFTSIAGATRNHVAAFTVDNVLDGSFNPNADAEVYALARQADGKVIVGGAFTHIDGQSRSYLARLNTDGHVDSGFNASVSGPVSVVAIQADGKVLCVTGPAGGATSTLVRLNADGSVDGGFNAQNDGAINSVAVQTDGMIVVGGTFTRIGGQDHKYLARLQANGTLDPSIVPVPDGPVTTVTLQPDGKIVFGGNFTTVADNPNDSTTIEPRFGLARIAATISPSQSFTAGADRTTVVWSRSGPAPEVNAVEFERSTDFQSWTSIGEGTRVPGTGNWQVAGVSLPVGTDVYVRITATIPVGGGGSSGLMQSYGRITASSVPVIGGGSVVVGNTGSSFAYSIVASGSPTSFAATGLPAGLSLNATTGVISGVPTVTGTFNVTITATNASGSTSKAVVFVISPPGPTNNAGRLANISVLGHVDAGVPIVAGFVIRGSSALSVLIQGVGPTLPVVNPAISASAVLATPHLRLHNRYGDVIKEADSWSNDAAISAADARLGATPLATNSADAAMLVTLNSGPYTVHIGGPNSTTGTALAEIYDASQNPPPANSPELVNISARGTVSSDPLVAGFVIVGSTSRTLLIRGVGPALLNQGLITVLTNPALTLHRMVSGSPTVVAQNDDWGTPTDSVYSGRTAGEIAAAATQAGAFALASGSHDAAILVTLPPGIYTATVSNNNGTGGDAMVEVYLVQ